MISFSRTMFASKDRKTNRLICETVSSADEYEQICKTTQSCYEVIPFDIPVCLYADIDCKHPVGECMFDLDHTQIFIDYAERAIACNLSIKPRFAIAVSSCSDYTNCDNKRYMALKVSRCSERLSQGNGAKGQQSEETQRKTSRCALSGPLIICKKQRGCGVKEG